MILEHLAYIVLPPHANMGGFDHADTHCVNGRMYVAHTANNAVDVIDCITDSYLYSIPGLAGVAGVLVSESANLVFTSNRGEDTIGIFAPDAERDLFKVPVGHRPNGLAFDPRRQVLLAANVGDPALAHPPTASIVDINARSMIASVLMPGRTRWAMFDEEQESFFVNIATPACIVAIDAASPREIARSYKVPADGPHGLAIDNQEDRLFCACDAKTLICLDSLSGRVLSQLPLSGAPDVIFMNEKLGHLYVASGVPGVIDVVDTQELRLIETVSTEPGAHTMGFDAQRNKIYAFLPVTHRAAVYRDSGRSG